jgi:hypothetical protein
LKDVENVMKILISGIMVLFVTAILRGENSLIQYKSTIHGYSVSIPADWVQKTNYERMELYAYDPKGMQWEQPSTVMTFVGEKNPPDENLEQFSEQWSRHIDSIMGKLGDYREEGSGHLKIDGVDAVWKLHSTRLAGHGNKSIDYLVIHKGTRYLITCTSPIQHFETFKTQCQQVLNSFRF